jgi:glycosyltransferase involved in cell wall biosynthesis
VFEGKLPTHDDVICQIRKSRFALLPLKIDLVSGTIREAMANGLPVVTTVTPATPNLNKKRECVLLSEMGDHKAMADNMLRLIEDPEYANIIRDNCLQTANERITNKEIVDNYIRAYFNCISDFKQKSKA